MQLRTRMPTRPERSFSQGDQPAFASCVARMVLVLALLTDAMFRPAASAAEPVDEVRRLADRGETTEALRRADAALTIDPSDPSLRFVKGSILADAQRHAEAIAVFEKLTDDYPDLAEPYNNLAALYAATGRFEKARAALEQALRINPTYATAWENLGDVLVALASEAYAKVGRLDPGNMSSPPKLRAARAVVPRSAAGSTGPLSSVPSTRSTLLPTP